MDFELKCGRRAVSVCDPRALMLLLNPKNKNHRILTEAVNFLLVTIYGYFFRPEQNLSGQNIVLKGMLFQDAVKSFKKAATSSTDPKTLHGQVWYQNDDQLFFFLNTCSDCRSWYPMSTPGQFSDLH